MSCQKRRAITLRVVTPRNSAQGSLGVIRFLKISARWQMQPVIVYRLLAETAEFRVSLLTCVADCILVFMMSDGTS